MVCLSLVETRASRPARNIFTGFRVYQKPRRLFFSDARLAATSDSLSCLAAVDGFRPGFSRCSKKHPGRRWAASSAAWHCNPAQLVTFDQAQITASGSRRHFADYVPGTWTALSQLQPAFQYRLDYHGGDPITVFRRPPGSTPRRWMPATAELTSELICRKSSFNCGPVSNSTRRSTDCILRTFGTIGSIAVGGPSLRCRLLLCVPL